MKLFLHDPRPPSNEYVAALYFGPLRSYCADHGIEIELVDDPESVKNGILLICGDYLSHERIERIKNNGTKLVIFDINDSSYISATYGSSPLWTDADLIFKISGVPNRNESPEPSIDANFKITTTAVKYLPDDEWDKFQAVRHKIKPLPYTLWGPLVPQDKPVNPNRNGRVLVGGGSHFWRVILFFKLVQQGLNDPSSQFATNAYFADDMVPQFRYCQECRDERKANGKTPYSAVHDPAHCTGRGQWGTEGDIVGGPGYGNQFGKMNNVCPAAFFWWSKEYERLSGPLNDQIEKALNGTFRPAHEFCESLSKTSYYADYKPLNTIYVPPRFWEAASVGTPSLYPARTADQDHWPAMVEDEHYYTYREDMSDFGLGSDSVPPKHWELVSKSVKDLYETKIRGTDYAISNALLEYMKDSIEEIL